jgi:uncharacterized protein
MMVQSPFKNAVVPVTPKPLSDEELDQLNEFLVRFCTKQRLNLEAFDGFLAALICGPENVPQTEYLAEICGDDVIDDEALVGEPAFQDFIALIAGHWISIAHALQSGAGFTPLLLADEHGLFRGNDWATGFMRGMELRRIEWAPLVNDDENSGSLVPIFALAHENDPDPEMRPYAKPISAEMREKLIVGAAAGVMKIYRYFKTQRRLPTHSLGDSATFRRFARKVGRNEPCPCGSGKKFKQCCGKITVH